MDATPKKNRKSGSEQRQKQRRITFRLAPEEYASIESAANDAGVTIGTYIRGAVLMAPQTRRRRRPPIEVEAVAKLQAAMNRVGGNIHQLVRRANFGEMPFAHEYHEALDGYKEVIAAILTTLGRGQR